VKICSQRVYVSVRIGSARAEKKGGTVDREIGDPGEGPLKEVERRSQEASPAWENHEGETSRSGFSTARTSSKVPRQSRVTLRFRK
jgi:hypothetical protein